MSSFLGSSWKQVGGYQRTPVGNYARFPYLASELAFIDNISSGIVPIGGIIMWSGATINLQNWVLCDGTSYVIKGNTIQTPDLRNRFIFGSGTYSVDTSGGSTIISVNQMPKHSHIINIADPGHNHPITDPGHNHVVNDPGHNHSITDIGHLHPITDPGHIHDVSNNTHTHGVNDPGHRHQYEYGGVESSPDNGPAATAGGGGPGSGNRGQTSTTGTGLSLNPASSNVSLESANTTISINNNTTGIIIDPSFTDISLSPNTTGIIIDISFTNITSTADTSGNSEPYMPLYYVLAFIMRIS